MRSHLATTLATIISTLVLLGASASTAAPPKSGPEPPADGKPAAKKAQTAPPTATAAPKTAAPEHPTQIRSGKGHSCVLRGNKVRCWGLNGRGQVGDGTQLTRAEAVPVVGLPKGRISQLMVASNTSCVLYDNQQAWCWGNYNRPEQRHFKPGRVFGLGDKITDLAVGANHLCAVSAKGVVSCLGRNHYGQLGHPVMHFTSVAKPKLSEPATRVFGLGEATCAALRSGKLACWGRHLPGLFGKTGDGCLKIPPRKHGWGCDHVPVIVPWAPAKPGPTRQQLSAMNRDVCLIDQTGRVSCVLQTTRHLVLPGAGGRIRPVEVSLGGSICVRTANGEVHCAGLQADVCQLDARGRRRCRSTLGTAAGADWDSAFTRIPAVDDAVSISSSRKQVCVVRRSGPVQCLKIDRRGAAPDAKPSVIGWRKTDSLTASRAAVVAKQAALRAAASTDLFAGARWLIAAQKRTHATARDQIQLAKRLLQAGRTKEGLAMAATHAKMLPREMETAATARRCGVAALLTQVPGEWLWYGLDKIMARCATRWTPVHAALVAQRLAAGIDAANPRDQSMRHRLAAELLGRRGQATKAAAEYAMTGSRDRDLEKLSVAVELGYAKGATRDIDRLAEPLPGALEALLRAPKAAVAVRIDTRAPHRVKRRIGQVEKLAPALSRLGRGKQAKRLLELAFKLISAGRMGGLTRAQMYARIATAALKSGRSQGQVRKKLRKARGWLAAGAKVAARDRSPSGKSKLDYALTTTRGMVAEALLAAGDIKGALKVGLHLAARDQERYLLAPLMAAGRFAAAQRVVKRLTPAWAQRGARQKLILAAAAAGACKVVAAVAEKLPLYELKADPAETIGLACPKEVKAALATMDRGRSARQPSVAILRATQGEWVPALQALASVSLHDRPRHWAHVAALWQLAGAPKPEGLKPVVEAILEP